MIDNFDRKIMESLQADYLQTIAQISDSVGLSPSACHCRIGLLEERVVALTAPESLVPSILDVPLDHKTAWRL